MTIRDLLQTWRRPEPAGDDQPPGGPLLDAVGTIMGSSMGRVHSDHGVLDSEDSPSSSVLPDGFVTDLAGHLSVSADTARTIATFALTRLVPALAGSPPAPDLAHISPQVMDCRLDELLQGLGATPQAQQEFLRQNRYAGELARQTGLDESQAAASLVAVLALFRERLRIEGNPEWRRENP